MGRDCHPSHRPRGDREKVTDARAARAHPRCPRGLTVISPVIFNFGCRSSPLYPNFDVGYPSIIPSGPVILRLPVCDHSVIPQLPGRYRRLPCYHLWFDIYLRRYSSCEDAPRDCQPCKSKFRWFHFCVQNKCMESNVVNCVHDECYYLNHG